MHIEYPPVEEFFLNFFFVEVPDPDVYTLNEICQNLDDAGYKSPPRIKLHSSKGPDPRINLGPLMFVSETEGNEILIFNDSIQFIFHEYSSFDEILPKILENFFSLADILEIKTNNRITVKYIDIFNQFLQKSFNINNYFNIYLEYPETFILDNKDFVFGIRLETDKINHTPIIRLRGRNPDNEECFSIQLETIYNVYEEIEIEQKEKIEDLINYAHDCLIDYFKKILTKKTKLKIGMDDGTDS